MKPILFNAEMVRAILDGRKTGTRRVVKPQPVQKICYHAATDKWFYCNGMDVGSECKPPYQPGDILYVRETFSKAYGKGYYYAADYDEHDVLPADRGDVSVSKNMIKWRPSIHMPKEAARIFLRVTGVRVERLQDITGVESIAEGVEPEALSSVGEDFAIGMFHDIWDSTIKPDDLSRYGWQANPWVWVIEFERISKEEALT